MKDKIISMIDDSIKAKEYLKEQADLLSKVALIIYEAFCNGNRLFIFGNGGSAADAQHIAAEFVGRFKRERAGLPAIALTTDTSFITAWSNDYPEGFQTIFERQIGSLAKKGDILLGLSTSGVSENMIRAFKKGKEIGTYNISLTGKTGGKLKELSDLNLHIPIENSARIQEAHETAYHIICEIIDEKTFLKENES